MNRTILGWLWIALVVSAAPPAWARATRPGSGAGVLAGQVSSSAGAPIPSVAIAVIAPNGQIRVAVSGEGGRFLVNSLPAGRYTVWAWSKGFALYQDSNLRIAPGHKSSLDILLRQDGSSGGPGDGPVLITAHSPASLPVDSVAGDTHWGPGF